MKTTTNDWSTFNWSSSFGPQACCPFLMTRWVLEDFSTTALVVQIIVSIMVTWPLPIARKFPLIVRLVLLVWTNPPLKWVVNGRSNNTVTTQCYHVCLWGALLLNWVLELTCDAAATVVLSSPRFTVLFSRSLSRSRSTLLEKVKALSIVQFWMEYITLCKI